MNRRYRIPKRYSDRSGGMSLVEVMVSVLLVALVVGGVLGLVIQNMKMGTTIDCNYAAINIAKSRVDRIRELRREKGYAYLNTAAETAGIKVDREGTPSAEGDFTRYTYVTTNYGGNSNLTNIRVRVDYKAAGDVSTTTIEVQTLISPYM